MKVKNVDIITSPDNADRVRLVGDVVYDAPNLKPEQYWFEVDKKYKDDISITGNPWLVCLIPLAVTLGEPIELCCPVDKVLFKNVQELMKIWKSWYSHLHIVPIEAELLDVSELVNGKKVVAFFSGGVDSFFTILRPENNNIENLITVHGFDVPIENVNAFIRMEKSLDKVAREIGSNLVSVTTNLRKTSLEKAGWGQLYFGSTLASVGLFLEPMYKKVLIASGGEGFALSAWGSHPLTDPLYSTSRMEVVHDSLAITRMQKLEFISNFKIAQNHLRVCWQGRSYENCCACPKCYRTMAALSVLGVLDKFPSFRTNTFDISKASRIYLHKPDKPFFEQIMKVAEENNIKDILLAIQKSYTYSDRLDTFLPIVRQFDNWLRKFFRKKRFLWRLAELSLEKKLLRNSIA